MNSLLARAARAGAPSLGGGGGLRLGSNLTLLLSILSISMSVPSDRALRPNTAHVRYGQPNGSRVASQPPRPLKPRAAGNTTKHNGGAKHKAQAKRSTNVNTHTHSSAQQRSPLPLEPGRQAASRRRVNTHKHAHASLEARGARSPRPLNRAQQQRRGRSTCKLEVRSQKLEVRSYTLKVIS